MNAILMLLLAADVNGQSTPDVMLLDFASHYCAPCRQMVPSIERMQNDGYPIQRIDTTEQYEMTRRYNVRVLPTLVLLVEGREVQRFEGFTGEDELRRTMDKAKRSLMASRRDSKSSNTSGDQLARNDEESGQTEAPRKPAGKSPGKSVRNLFGGAGDENTTAVRAQNDEIGRVDSKMLANAEAATVRLRVADDKLHDVGTGTIVYSKPGSSIILTCAHLFPVGREKKTKVEVDVFRDGKIARFPGVVMSGSHDSDLAFVKIQSTATLPSVPLFTTGATVQPGQAVVSFGCNNGDVPSILKSSVLKVNPYIGPANLTCSTDPVQGRSGGGLFSENGELLAVCSGAFRKEKEGLYMSHAAVAALAVQQQLEYVLTPRPESAGEEAAVVFTELEAASEESSVKPVGDSEAVEPGPFDEAPSFEEVATTAEVAFDDSMTNGSEEVREVLASAAQANASGSASVFDSGAPGDRVEMSEKRVPRTPVSSTELPGTTVSLSAPNAAGADAAGTEITVLINSREPGGQKRMIVIPRATPWLLELLTGEAGADEGGGVEKPSPELTSFGQR